MRELLRRAWFAIRQRRFEADLAEELDHHRQLKQQDLERRGLDPAEAAVEARRALGNVLVARERARDVWVWPWLQDVGQDLRFAGRLLVKDRWFTLAAATALALGIGATTAVFTILNAMSLRDLPVDRPDQILSLQIRDAIGRTHDVSYLDFRDWQQATRAFAGLAAFNGATMNVSDAGRAPDQHAGAFVSASTFHLLRVTPLVGRDFSSGDDRPGAPPVVILGHGVWTSRYSADPSVLGRTIRINAVPTTVIGVMPEGFKFPFHADLWQPLAARPGVTTQTRDVRGIGVFGRLADDVGKAQARTELKTIANRLAQQYPDTNTGIEPIVTTFNERYNGRLTESIPMVLMGAVGFVLLIACADVANLLLARSAHRAREIGIRASLGATRWRIVRQVLVESVLLAIVAGGLGFWVSVLGVRLFTGAVDDLAMPLGPVHVRRPGVRVSRRRVPRDRGRLRPGAGAPHLEDEPERGVEGRRWRQDRGRREARPSLDERAARPRARADARPAGRCGLPHSGLARAVPCGPRHRPVERVDDAPVAAAAEVRRSRTPNSLSGAPGRAARSDPDDLVRDDRERFAIRRCLAAAALYRPAAMHRSPNCLRF